MTIIRTYRKSASQNFFDPTLIVMLGIVFIFSLISFIALYSASNGDIYPWAFKQLLNFIVFFGIMLLIRIMNTQIIYDFSYFIYFICLAILLVAEFSGYNAMGAQRWIKIGAFNIQPSEFTKIGIILALAKYFQNSLHDNINKPEFLIIPILIFIAPAALILKQPNLGTTIITLMIALSIYWTAGINKWYFIIPCMILILMMPFIWSMLHDYQKTRILIFLNPEYDLLGSGYNIAQSKIAIGAGKLLGKGFMNGSQNQLCFVPEKHTDFILTLLAEEWGFLGFIFILLLYITLILFCYRIAFNALDHFSKIISIGVGTMIFAHVFVNMSMISGLLPAVGTPIPFLSYGGSNLAANLIGIGLILNIDRNSKLIK